MKVKEGEATKERFLDAFLADTTAEAEEVYSSFSNLLNSMAYSWHRATGLEKVDLFSEGLVGLARAKRDFDPTRSEDFKTFAIYKIKDALSDYTRRFMNTVVVPSYVAKAKSNLVKLYSCMANHDLPEEMTDALIGAAFSSTSGSYTLNASSAGRKCCSRCKKYIDNIIHAADRAKISPKELFDMLEAIPTTSLYEETSEPDYIEELIDTKRFRARLDTIERYVFDQMLEGKSCEEIGAAHLKSKSWASNMLKTIKDKWKEAISEDYKSTT